MYLLTWTRFALTKASTYTDRDVALHIYTVKEGSGHELFERRGNDWIRIRPEEG